MIRTVQVDAMMRHSQKLANVGILAGWIVVDIHRSLGEMSKHISFALNGLSAQGSVYSHVAKANRTVNRAVALLLHSFPAAGQEEGQKMPLAEEDLVAAGLLAHRFFGELGPLLRSILTQTLVALAKLEDPHRARVCMVKASEAAECAANLAARWVTYGRAGKDGFHAARLNLNRLVKESLMLLPPGVMKERGLCLRLGLDLPAVLVDKEQFQQVIVELLVNALEAMREKDQPQEAMLTVETNREGITAVSSEQEQFTLSPKSGPSTYVCLTVSDTGAGMDTVTIRRLFDPRFSVKEPGKGLGLFILQDVVKKHHGGIQVYARPGHGSTFKIFLPV